MRKLKTLHLASFDGNIGDNANHAGFYKFLGNNNNFLFDITKLEIREFYWKQRFFDEDFVRLVNAYDLVIVGGGNYFELWVETSPTGTSIAIEPELYRKINTPFIFNSLGVDPGQGASALCCDKFRKFLDVIIDKKDFLSIRNDGSKKAISDCIGDNYLADIISTIDAGLFVETDPVGDYFNDKKYIAINVVNDIEEERFDLSSGKLSYQEFLVSMKNFVTVFLSDFDHEIVFVPHIYRDLNCINDIMLILDDDI